MQGLDIDVRNRHTQGNRPQRNPLLGLRSTKVLVSPGTTIAHDLSKGVLHRSLSGLLHPQAPFRGVFQLTIFCITSNCLHSSSAMILCNLVTSTWYLRSATL